MPPRRPPKTNRVVYIQFTTTSGLCNRLRGWAGIGAVADLAGAPFWVLWAREAAFRAEFNDLFLHRGTHPLHHKWFMSSFPKAIVFRRHVGRLAATKPTDYYKQFVPPARRQHWDDAVRHRISELQLRAKHRLVVERFWKTLPPDLIGLHVRRTDHTQQRDANPRLFAKLDSVIEEEPNIKFLLCTEDPITVKLLREKYGKERMLWREQHMDTKRRSKRATSAADSAIDLFLLAKCTRLIGTRRSSFSGFAARMARAPIEYV